MGEHFLLTFHEGSCPFKMVLPHAKTETEITSLAVSLRIFIIFVFLLPIKSLKQIQSEGAATRTS